jgi:hypothetical protein
MKVKIITSILHLQLESKEPLLIDGITFVNYHEASVFNFLGESFLKVLGLYGRQKIKKDCALACTEFLDPIEVNDPKDEQALEIASHTSKNYIVEFLHLLKTFSTFLWFVRDNSCNLVDVLCHSSAKSVAGLIPTDYRRIVTCCDGEFIDTIFTTMEIDAAMAIRKKFFELCPLYNASDEEYEPITNNKGHSENPHLRYVRELNALEHAFTFLRAAREHRDLVPKFAMYMTVLESLFGFEKTEVTFRICARAAIYLGNDRKEMKSIYKVLSECYNFRSNFAHGTTSPKEYREQSYRTEKIRLLDGYVRAALTKIITKDHEYFLKENDRIKFLSDMLFPIYSPFAFDPSIFDSGSGI